MQNEEENRESRHGAVRRLTVAVVVQGCVCLLSVAALVLVCVLWKTTPPQVTTIYEQYPDTQWDFEAIWCTDIFDRYQYRYYDGLRDTKYYSFAVRDMINLRVDCTDTFVIWVRTESMPVESDFAYAGMTFDEWEAYLYAESLTEEERAARTQYIPEPEDAIQAHKMRKFAKQSKIDIGARLENENIAQIAPEAAFYEVDTEQIYILDMLLWDLKKESRDLPSFFLCTRTEYDTYLTHLCEPPIPPAGAETTAP